MTWLAFCQFDVLLDLLFVLLFLYGTYVVLAVEFVMIWLAGLLYSWGNAKYTDNF